MKEILELGPEGFEEHITQGGTVKEYELEFGCNVKLLMRRQREWLVGYHRGLSVRYSYLMGDALERYELMRDAPLEAYVDKEGNVLGYHEVSPKYRCLYKCVGNKFYLRSLEELWKEMLAFKKLSVELGVKLKQQGLL